MFKAKLIEDQSYYPLRGKQALLAFIPSILIGVLVNVFQLPLWITILSIGIYVFVLILFLKNQKALNSAAGNRLIEINDTAIKIKSKNKTVQEVIKIEEVEKITLTESYQIPQESVQAIAGEIKGKHQKNYLMIQQKNKNRRFDFEIDSYYMITQLNKIIDYWISQGYQIEKK